MACEQRRACGYRKTGGLYLCGSGSGLPCCKLPVILHVCPTCNQGVKQTRGWSWIDPRPWLTGTCSQGALDCPAANPGILGDKVGLLWIGAQFYPTPASFTEEAGRLGISRRITAIPRGFKVGEHWVFLAHPKVKFLPSDIADEEGRWVGGVFRIFRPDRIEKIITATDAQDEAELAKLEKAGITPIVVEDDDKDHKGTVYDDDLDDAEPVLPLQ